MESNATMEDAATEVTPPHGSLPDEMVIWEILTRLPPKPLLRCRAVCHAWRSASSTRDFLLAHHARQPLLPILCRQHKRSVDILTFDHQAAVDDQLQPVARLDSALFNLQASCDGLIIVSDRRRRRFSICNPTTREYAPLQQLDEFAQHDDLTLLGMYPHVPTGEYRLVGKLRVETDDLYGNYYAVFTLGSSQPPRPIGGPDEWVLDAPILFNNSLHWYVWDMLMVFDTIAETFREMRHPIVPSGDVDLFESGGTLGISRFDERAAAVDIWMMQDYEAEVWAFRHRVELPVAELTKQFGPYSEHWRVLIPSWNGEVFGLVKFNDWLLQIDIDAKVISRFHHHERLVIYPFWLKQTLLPHTFFPTLEGYVVNESPFT